MFLFLISVMAPQGVDTVKSCILHISLILASVTAALGVTDTSLGDTE